MGSLKKIIWYFSQGSPYISVYKLCVCVCEREREREIERDYNGLGEGNGTAKQCPN